MVINQSIAVSQGPGVNETWTGRWQFIPAFTGAGKQALAGVR